MSNRCFGGSCQPCSAPADCPSMTCIGGICLGTLWDPCAVDNDCANGVKCTNNLCRNPLGAACSSYNECSTGFCFNNPGTCTACTKSADCANSFYPAKASCLVVNGVGSCQLPPTAYCYPVYPTQCQSQACPFGFPPKCL